jgi:hypothetical protein|tara:strand:- start:237 stop:464 length:228 start_codon:yes stop_codon:yes gene_type:complete
MWTNEFDFDETVTTIMDDHDVHDDLHIFIDDNEVFLRQWCETLQRYELINISHRMWYEVQKAMKTTEGIFRIEYE